MDALLSIHFQHKMSEKGKKNKRIIDSFKNGDNVEDWHINDDILKISTKNYGDDEIGLTSEQITEL